MLGELGWHGVSRSPMDRGRGYKEEGFHYYHHYFDISITEETSKSLLRRIKTIIALLCLYLQICVFKWKMSVFMHGCTRFSAAS